MNLQEVWRRREAEIYPALFGPVSRGTFALSQKLFTRLGADQVDPRWLTYGVLEFAPTETRPSWLYVTSGHSNPWHQAPADYNPAGESGVGVEFTLAVKERGDWAILALQSMLALDLMQWAGRMPNPKPMVVHDRIALGAPLDGRPECVLRNLVMAEADGVPREFDLPSGKVFLVSFTAMSDSEIAFAEANGSAAAIARLRQAGAHPVVDPSRPSLF